MLGVLAATAPRFLQVFARSPREGGRQHSLGAETGATVPAGALPVHCFVDVRSSVSPSLLACVLSVCCYGFLPVSLAPRSPCLLQVQVVWRWPVQSAGARCRWSRGVARRRHYRQKAKLLAKTKSKTGSKTESKTATAGGQRACLISCVWLVVILVLCLILTLDFVMVSID